MSASLPLADTGVQYPLSPAARHGHSSPQPLPHTVLCPPPTPLTSAQISRAAARTVRLAFAHGQARDAFFVLNSLRHSLYRDKPEEQIPKQLLRLLRPVDFGQPISPRLSAHALLHSLIREGSSFKAVKQAQLMMSEGFNIRPKTLNAVMHALTASASPVEAAPKVWHDARVLTLDGAAVKDPCARYAVTLLLEARKNKHHRSQEMYQSAINLCLLQGEIIVAALLFALLVKDWQLKRALTASLDLSTPAAPPETDGSAHHRATISPLSRVYPEIPRPSLSTLLPILNAVDSVTKDCDRSSNNPAVQASAQALATLASLLEERRFPFGAIGPLIRSLYSFPRSYDTSVFIVKGDSPTRVRAYDYVHQVIYNLARCPPTEQVRVKCGAKDPPLLPPLQVSTYNSLLHYALRHRLSPALASAILEHMTAKRQGPLAPDIVTYNILLRSATLLRRHDIAAQVLQVLEGKKKDGTLTSEVGGARKAEAAKAQAGKGRLPRALAQAKTEDISAAVTSPTSPGTRTLVPDTHTLCTYIADLTSTGRPHVARKILFELYPGLPDRLNHSWAKASPERSEERSRREAYERALERAIQQGPWVLTALLNALAKAGSTGLAERLWFFAKQAEARSWERATNATAGSPHDGPTPSKTWFLPVHAYTIMMQVYAAEGRKYLRPTRDDDLSDGREDGDWRHHTDRKRLVKGWGYLFAKSGRFAPDGVPRRLAARKMGIALSRNIRNSANSVYAQLKEAPRLQDLGPQALLPLRRDAASIPPRPDARFYNAALELMARHEDAVVRAPRPSRVRWRRRLRIASERFRIAGTVSSHGTPEIREVCAGMVEAGYQVPPAFEYVLIGHGAPLRVANARERDSVSVRPWAFTPRSRQMFTPHALSTERTRGLPVGRKVSVAEAKRARGSLRRPRGREKGP